MRRGKLLRRGLTSLLAVTLVFSLMPAIPSNATTVYAAGTTTTDKKIVLGTDVIKDPTAPTSISTPWQGNYVYFGTYNGQPVKYRVLDSNTSVFSGTTMLLDCDTILWSGTNPSSAIDSDGSVIDWANSDIRTYLNGTFLTENFTKTEQNAIASSTKNAAVTGDGQQATGMLTYAPLDGEKIFLLDAVEARNTSYGYSNTADYGTSANRVKTGGNNHWWLRSPNPGSKFVGVISNSGQVVSAESTCAHGISPALNVNLSSVLFSSLVDGTTAGQNGAAYKLTLFDSAMTVAQNGTITRDDGTITIPYTITGDDSKNATQVSVLLLSKPYKTGDTKNTEVYYYGALDTDSFSTTGKGTFKLPASLLAKTCGSDYYAYIIAEDVNGTKETDYASTPVAITIEKENIESVAVTGIEAPKATYAFDTVASCHSKGVGTSAPDVTWTPTSATGKAAFNTTYTASVTLSPADGYVFTKDTNATVDGSDATSVTKNSNGTLTITYTFGTRAANRTIAGLGTSTISDPTPPSSASDGWQGNYVYFGTYDNQPVKYRVLDAETTDYSAAKTMLLDCDSALLDTNGKVWVSPFDSSTKVWSNSAIRTYLNGTFLTSGFTPTEQSTIAYSTKKGKSNSDGPGNTEHFSFAQMNGDRIFLLDAMEATNKSYGYSEDSGKAANRLKSATTGSYARWWLRSPNCNFDGCAAHVGTTGHIGSIGVSGDATVNDGNSGSDVAVCPAFNLDLSKVLFSAVVPDASTGTAYELTLIDSDMTIALDGEVTRSENTVTIPYTITGNDSGNATQVSVLLLSKEYTAGNANNAEILYYGKLNTGDFSKTGTGTFVLPENVLAKSCGSGYYAYIIAEDLNGTALTDYASTPVSIDIGKAEINSVAITDITAPTARHALDVGAYTSTTGIELKTPIVTWKQGETVVTGSAAYLTVYTANVTLEADDGHQFANNVTATVNGQDATSVASNADGTITVSYTFAATEKRTVSTVGGILIPNAVDGADGSRSGTFTDYHTASDVVTNSNSELEKMVTVTFADGESTDVAITWTVEGDYNETPGTDNIFRWTLPDTYNYADGVASTGTVTIKNKAAIPVTITARDESFDYDTAGAQIDVSQCFIIDANAGEASYELVTDDTATDAGVGTLDGSTLSVTKVGTFQIKLTTAANGNYAAGEDIAKITVNHGTMQCVVLDYTCTYDGKPHTLDDTTFTIPEGATITYSTDGAIYNEEKPTFLHVGTYPVYYQIVKENYDTITGTKYVTIQTRTISVIADDQRITFGDVISQAGYTSDGLATGDAISVITLTPSTAVCTHNGAITVGDVKITNENSEDVTADYDIVEVPGTLVIEHNDNAPVTSISASKQKVSYVLGDTLDVDDISVYGTCEDGDNEPISSGFTTNASEVDMRSIGDKTLTVSFNGHTADIAIVVQPKTVTVTVENCSKHMDAADPEFTYTAEGLLDGDSLDEITFTRESGEVPGNYVITASEKEGANPNYTLHFQTGELTIEDHEWSETWTVKREASADKEGLESTSCNVCGQTRTRAIPKTGASTETPDAQKIEKSVEVGTNSTIEDVEITSDRDTLKKDVLATENFSDITEPRVWIEVSDAKNLSSTVETEFETKAADALSKSVDEILYTDINLYKSYTKDAIKTTMQVTTQLDDAIEISLLVPVSMRNTDARVTRTYQVLRMHDSQVDAIDSTYDAASYMLTFQTDRFSTYAIAYADTTVSDGSGSDGKDDSGSTGKDDSGSTGKDDSGSAGKDDSGSAGDDDSGSTGDDDSSGDDSDSGSTGGNNSGSTGKDNSGSTGGNNSGSTIGGGSTGNGSTSGSTGVITDGSAGGNTGNGSADGSTGGNNSGSTIGGGSTGNGSASGSTSVITDGSAGGSTGNSSASGSTSVITGGSTGGSTSRKTGKKDNAGNARGSDQADESQSGTDKSVSDNQTSDSDGSVNSDTSEASGHVKETTKDTTEASKTDKNQTEAGSHWILVGVLVVVIGFFILLLQKKRRGNGTKKNK